MWQLKIEQISRSVAKSVLRLAVKHLADAHFASFFGARENTRRPRLTKCQVKVPKYEKRWLAPTTLLFVSVSALPATADVRGQVQANATRCAIIGDDRQGSNCYHGAAQPAARF